MKPLLIALAFVVAGALLYAAHFLYAMWSVLQGFH